MMPILHREAAMVVRVAKCLVHLIVSSVAILVVVDPAVAEALDIDREMPTANRQEPARKEC